MIDNTYLISKSSTGKIRVCHFFSENINNIIVIHRETYQFKGKKTKQPDIIVDKGLAGRDIEAQYNIRYQHLVKEKLDSGYKEIENDPDEYSESELLSILGEVATNQDNVPKPMLAKQADKVTNKKIFDKVWMASRKIDGLRALIYMGNDNKLHTSSRGAMDYDAAMFQILSHPKLIQLFKENPGIILDGECYHHGYSLQQLSGIARTQKTAVDYDVLQFYWYDIVDPNSTFDERWSYMQDIRDKYEFEFNPEKEFNPDELRIQFVPQEEVVGWDNIMKLHNQYVSEGWEGVVVRDPDKVYKPKGRTNDMIKVKLYQSNEFLITGYDLGLRGIEDMVFNLITSEGKPFKAKPHGDRAQKYWYVDNFEDECLNHYANVKYFYMSDENVPLQPSVSSIRIKEDMPNE